MDSLGYTSSIFFKFKRWLVFKKWWVLCFILTVVAGCASDNNKESVRDLKGVLRLNLGGEPTILNPLLVTDASSHSVVRFVFNGLLKRNADLQMVPELAASYEVSDDGLTYTFKLREDVLWHDGVPFSADDVKFTFETLLDPKTNTVRRRHFVVGGEPIRWEVESDFLIKAILPKPFSPFIAVLNMEIIPKHLLSGKDINTGAFNRSPVGTGAFKFKEWRSGQYIRLSVNEHYFKGKPLLNEILLKIIPDTNTSLAALEKGEIDLSGLPSKDVERFEKKEFVDIYKYYGLNYTYMGINMRKPALSDLAVRQAIAHAINKEAIVAGVLKGYGRPAYIPSSPVSWAYPEESTIVKYDYDPARSKALLKQTGFVYDEAGGVFKKEGEPLALTLTITKGSQSTQKIAQMVQQYLSQVGIKVTIHLMEWSSFLKMLHAPIDPKHYDLVMLGWSYDINDPDDSYTVWHSSLYPSGSNLNGYNNPKVDQLLEQGRTQIDQQLRQQTYAMLFNQIAQDVPYVFLFHSESVVAANKRVKGLSKPGPGGVLNEIENVSVVDN